MPEPEPNPLPFDENDLKTKPMIFVIPDGYGGVDVATNNVVNFGYQAAIGLLQQAVIKLTLAAFGEVEQRRRAAEQEEARKRPLIIVPEIELARKRR